MHTCLFDMFHDAGNDRVITVSYAIHINFDGFLKKAIDQYGLVTSDDKGLGDVSLELRLVVANLHRPATKHKARPHQNWIADFRHDRSGFVHRLSNAVGRLLEIEFVQQLLEFFAIFGRLDGIDAGSNDRHTGIRKGSG